MKSLIVIVCLVALTAAGYINQPAACYASDGSELGPSECHNAALCVDMDANDMDCPCSDGSGPRDCTPEE